MPLTFLYCYYTRVSDLSPLQGMNLTEVWLTPKNITKGIDVIRQMKSLKTIGISAYRKDQFPADEFWKKYDAGEFGKSAPHAKPITDINDPAFQQWMKDVQRLPAEKQVEAVAKKLVELNPGFDGNVTGYDGKSPPKIEKGMVTELGLVTDNVTNISPLRALPGLKILGCGGSGRSKGQISDLSPLRGMALTTVSCSDTKVSDLSPLEGMPLTRLSCFHTNVSSLLPLQGMKLTSLSFHGTQVSDLSPLRGLPLTIVGCGITPVSDLSPLQDCKSLTKLSVTNTKVTPATVAALQKALPNCKIEWDDPAKPKTPEPAGPGTK